MTVKELIGYLRELPQDQIVVVSLHSDYQKAGPPTAEKMVGKAGGGEFHCSPSYRARRGEETIGVVYIGVEW